MESKIRTSKSLLVTLSVLLGLAVLAGQADPPIAPRYKITDLDPLGSFDSYAYDINESGQVVGCIGTAEWWYNGHAFLWEDGVMYDLSPSVDDYNVAYSINASGRIVGEAYDSIHAVLWEDGEMHDLAPGGSNRSEAIDVNDAGLIVGYVCTPGEAHMFEYRAALWEDGVIRYIAGPESAAYGINSSGQVVGWSDTESKYLHAFLWEDGVGMQDLGALGGAASESVGTAINDAGQVVGRSGTEGGLQHAFLWENGVGMQDLGALGGDRSDAYDINTSGQVVGYADTADWDYHAFLWVDGVMQDLNTLVPTGSGWELHEARAINDFGQIVGSGDHNGETHAFLLTPTIHPHTATIQAGRLVSGDVQSVAASDGFYHVVRAVKHSRRQIVEVHYTGTSTILNPSWFDFRYQGVGGGSSRPDVKVCIYNYISSGWDRVAPTTLRGTDNTWMCNVVTDVGRYVNSITGEMKCKVSLTTTSSRGNCIGCDLVEWAVSP